MAKTIAIAGREMRRLVGAAVGKDFLKTLTEPITNSDSNLKKQAGVPHAAGLIDACLKLEVGDSLNSFDLKRHIPKRKHLRRINLEISTAGKNNRLCRVIDTGTGMTKEELERNFGKYASAKAHGEKTRSLFGRGALDVLLYHDLGTIYSIKGGLLTQCKFSWDKNNDPQIEVTCEGAATKRLLTSHGIPLDLLDHGTVVQFKVREGTHIPLEDQIVAKISSFYMLRLIASDPNSEVVVARKRASGEHVETLKYDFPVGIVVLKATEELDLGKFGKLPIDILLARSDVPLQMDAMNCGRRENGLLFVDDNDAVLDLTLLPEYDKNPYLKHLYGVVRVGKLRNVLEARLDDAEAEAVLTTTRDGFDLKSEITSKLFAVVERHVKPFYEAEEKSQKKGASNRSEKLGERVSEALKAINQFNADETEEKGDAVGPKPLSNEAIFFGVESIRLITGVSRKISAYVNLSKVKSGELVLFESDRTAIKVLPDLAEVKGRKNQTHCEFELNVTCDIKGEKGTITAITLDNTGKEVTATLRVLGVDDKPVFVPPEDIEFSAFRMSGDPNRDNNATLLVNLEAFKKMPEVIFRLDEIVGNVTLAEGKTKLALQVDEGHVTKTPKIAKLVVPFNATGWGQQAVLKAQAIRGDGKVAEAKCTLKFEHPEGGQKFSDFVYEDLGRNVLGDVAGNKLYVNSGYSLHRQIFGNDEGEFNRRLESDPAAQQRAAAVLVETAVFHTATTKHQAGGKKGLHINPDDPIGNLRPYLDESKMKLEPKVYKALVISPLEPDQA